MKLLVALLLLLVAQIYAQQLDCSDVFCTLAIPNCEAQGSCLTLEGCCETCCDKGCVECLVSPCENWSCFGHPEFTCREDYCGGCNRHWYDGTGLKTECEAELFDQHPCATVLCAEVDESTCEGCGVVRDGCCDTCCPTECANCLVDPCENYSCQGSPGFTCKSNYCGGCNRDWYTSAGERTTCAVEIYGEHACSAVTCMPPDVEDCPVGSCGLKQGDGCCMECCEGPCVRCAINPCENYTCDDNPNYTCQTDYCGGCNRQWLREDSGDVVHCFNERLSPPHNGSDDCLDTFCPLILLDCPCGTTTVNCCPACCDCENDCEQNPCDLISCASDRELECRPNYCGGNCGHEWFDADGSPAKCEREIFDTITAPDWKSDCRHDWECSLRNVDHEFACCYEGMCDPIDYDADSWVAVNDRWWQERHDRCSRDCGPMPACPIDERVRDIPEGPTSISAAVCVSRHCVKVQGANPSERPVSNFDDDKHSRNSRHSNRILRKFSVSEFFSNVGTELVSDSASTPTRSTFSLDSFSNTISAVTDSLASWSTSLTNNVTSLFSTMTSFFIA